MNSHHTADALQAAGLFAPPIGIAPLSHLFFLLLADAEARYGPRDRSWTFGGLNYRTAGGPGTLASTDGTKRVVICLTQDALGDEVLQRWQLAHEVVHLLSPSGPQTTSVLEEGLASYNQFVHSSGGYTGDNLFPRSPLDYQRAFEATKPLVERHPSGIRNLRAECVQMSQVTPAQLIKHFPGTDANTAQWLCSCFYQ